MGQLPAFPPGAPLTPPLSPRGRGSFGCDLFDARLLGFVVRLLPLCSRGNTSHAYPRFPRYGICGAVSGGSNPEARGSGNVSIVRFTATNPCAR